MMKRGTDDFHWFANLIILTLCLSISLGGTFNLMGTKNMTSYITIRSDRKQITNIQNYNFYYFYHRLQKCLIYVYRRGFVNIVKRPYTHFLYLPKNGIRISTTSVLELWKEINVLDPIYLFIVNKKCYWKCFNSNKFNRPFRAASLSNKEPYICITKERILKSIMQHGRAISGFLFNLVSSSTKLDSNDIWV